jgi:predicted ATPase
MLEFKNRLTPGSYTYLQGQCLHYGDSIIYLPILDIIKSYFEIEEGDREFIIRKKIKEKVLGLDEKLEHTIPSFQELLSLKTDDEEYLKLEPKVKRERTFEAIRDLFIRESQNRPLILVVEDLHWIDRTSEEFLERPDHADHSLPDRISPSMGEQDLLQQDRSGPAWPRIQRGVG